MASSGVIMNRWLSLSEWKRWALCWPFIAAVYFLAFIPTIALAFPLSEFKNSAYLICLPLVLQVFALHAGIFMALPRGKRVVSLALTLLGSASLIFAYNDGKDSEFIFAELCLTVGSMFSTVVLWRLNRTLQVNNALRFYGMSFVVSGFGVWIICGLIALGMVWEVVHRWLGFLAYLLFIPAAPIWFLVVPIYKICQGHWTILLWLIAMPLAGRLILAFGSWVTGGESDMSPSTRETELALPASS